MKREPITVSDDEMQALNVCAELLCPRINPEKRGVGIEADIGIDGSMYRITIEMKKLEH